MTNLTTTTEEEGYITGLSVALNKLCKNGKLISEGQKGIRGLFYGLAEWKEDNGELQPYYKYRMESKKVIIIETKKK